MNQRAMDELRRRVGMQGWMFYLWAVPTSAGTIYLAWLTFRYGLWYVIADPADFYLLVIMLIVCVSLWWIRPRKNRTHGE
jgi:hypothetical protein